MEKQIIEKLMKELTKAEKENKELKAKGKFNMQQANNTMKRLTERLGSYFIKEFRRSQSD